MRFIFLALLWSPVLSTNDDSEKAQKAKIETLRLVHAVCFSLPIYRIILLLRFGVMEIELRAL